MNNYFIIGKVNEGKSYLFNLFSKTHKTISNPKANTTIDVIRKNILSENFEYNIYDTPGFYKFTDFNKKPEEYCGVDITDTPYKGD